MEDDVPQKSQLAKEIEALKSSLLAAEKKRHPLPQPLFWSLFHSRLKSIKNKKELQDTLTSIFGSES